MDPNNYDHCDIYFQDNPKRYMRDFEVYQQFLALCNPEVESSGSGHNTRTHIPRT
jgi:hypothetical protein